ncbi:YqhA family protein [Sulfurimonas sp.]
MDNRKNNNVDKIGSFVDKNLESKIFKFRHLVLFGVLGSLILSFLLFIAGLWEVILAGKYFVIEHDITKFSIYALKSADLFLFGTVMIIFSIGSYNLFVSKVDNVGTDTDENILPNWLNFADFGELKSLFIKVIILILSITFLELIIENSGRFANTELYNMLIIPIGVLMIAYSLKLIEHRKEVKNSEAEDKHK